MNKRTGRIIACVLATCLAASMYPVGAGAADSLKGTTQKDTTQQQTSVSKPGPVSKDLNQDATGVTDNPQEAAAKSAEYKKATSASSNTSPSVAPRSDSKCVVGVSTVEECFPDHALMQSVMRAGYAFDDSVFDETVIENVGRAGLDWDGSHAEKITSLEGIQYFPHLNYIDLENNNISDVSPLKGMHIDFIDLTNNKIVDASPLWTVHYAKDMSIWTLNLAQNRIKDLTGLNKTENLQDLNLQNNDLTNIEAMRGAPQLRMVSLSFNDITDFSPLWSDTTITQLSVNDNPHLTSLKGITALKNLYYLDIMCGYYSSVVTGVPGPNGILTSLKDIKGLPALRELDFSGNPITDLTPLEGMNSIVKIDGNQCGIDDLTPLKKMKGLTYIRFYSEQIKRSAVTAAKLNVSMKMPINPDGGYVAPTKIDDIVYQDAGVVDTAGTYDKETGTVNWQGVHDASNASAHFVAELPAVNPGNADSGTFFYSGDITQPFVMPGQWSVTFDSRGGSAVNPNQVTVYDDFTVSKPSPDPTKANMNFKGWSTVADDTLQNGTPKHAYDFSQPVKKNLVLYAQWTPSYYHVTFVYGNGEANKTIQVTNGSAATKPQDPTWSGYDFTGWWPTQDGSGNAYDFSTPVSHDITLYGKWKMRPRVSSMPLTGGKGPMVLTVVVVFLVLAGGAIAMQIARRKN